MTIGNTPAHGSAKPRYVGFWLRFTAFVIDSLLLTLLSAPWLMMSARSLLSALQADGGTLPAPGDEAAMSAFAYQLLAGTGAVDGRPLEPFWLLFNSVVLPLIVVVLFWRFRGATPGKMAIGAVIVDAASGKPAATAQLGWRFLAYLISLAPLGLGFLWCAWDPRKQAWHDKLAGTIVVRRRR